MTGDRFDMCYSHAQKVVEAGHVNQPAEVKDKTFCLISYYFDRAVESKLIGWYFIIVMTNKTCFNS